MKTSTLLLVLVVVVVAMNANKAHASSSQPTVTTPPKPTESINPAGSTFDKVMQAIAAVGGAVKAGIDASQERG